MSKFWIGYVIGILVGWFTAFCFVQIRRALTEIFVNRASRRLSHD